MELIVLKKIMFFLATLVMLFGCSDTDASNEISRSRVIYQGPFIEVGVAGSQQSLPNIENVQYKHVDLTDVNGIKEEFDVLIITPEAFPEADKDKYINLYESIEYPVLFFGMKDFKMFAFTTEGMTIENSKDDNVGYIEGFKNVNGEKEGIKVYKSEKEKESDAEILIIALNKLYEEKIK